MRVGPLRRLSTEELMLLNFGAGETLESHLDCKERRSNQSILKEIYLKYSLEGLMLKLKVQYFVHLNAKSQLIGKDSHAGKD